MIYIKESETINLADLKEVNKPSLQAQLARLNISALIVFIATIIMILLSVLLMKADLDLVLIKLSGKQETISFNETPTSERQAANLYSTTINDLQGRKIIISRHHQNDLREINQSKQLTLLTDGKSYYLSSTPWPHSLFIGTLILIASLMFFILALKNLLSKASIIKLILANPFKFEIIKADINHIGFKYDIISVTTPDSYNMINTSIGGENQNVILDKLKKIDQEGKFSWVEAYMMGPIHMTKVFSSFKKEDHNITSVSPLINYRYAMQQVKNSKYAWVAVNKQNPDQNHFLGFVTEITSA